MRRAIAVAIGFLIGAPACILAQGAFDGPPHAAKGYELFTKTAQPLPCANCHALGGVGTAVAPDLKMWAKLAPRATATAISSSVTDKVVLVEPKTGASFPGIKAGEDETTVKFFDLTKTPPELRPFPKAEVKTGTNTTWKHPPSTAKYTPEQLADLVSYIRWAGAKDKKPVTPDDIE